MPSHSIQTYKEYQNQKWSNVYLVNADTIDDARQAALTLMALELPILNTGCTLVGARVSTYVPGDDIYYSIPFNQNGSNASGSDLLPLWDAVRVDIEVVGGGRPSRKFYKGVLTEGITQNSVLAAGVITLFNGQIEAMITALANDSVNLVDPDNQLWLNPTTYPRIQMRQMHRKRKKGA